MTRLLVGAAIRLALGAYLLWQVYLGSRWALVVVLGLLYIETELQALLWRRLTRP